MLVLMLRRAKIAAAGIIDAIAGGHGTPLLDMTSRNTGLFAMQFSLLLVYLYRVSVAQPGAPFSWGLRKPLVVQKGKDGELDVSDGNYTRAGLERAMMKKTKDNTEGGALGGPKGIREVDNQELDEAGKERKESAPKEKRRRRKKKKNDASNYSCQSDIADCGKGRCSVEGTEAMLCYVGTQA